MRAGASNWELHEAMVREQIRAYLSEGTDVLAADVEGWTRPPPILGFVPDILAERHGRRVISEVETGEALESPETRAELEAYARAGLLEIMVPTSCLERARHAMSRQGIRVERWWRFPVL